MKGDQGKVGMIKRTFESESGESRIVVIRNSGFRLGCDVAFEFPALMAEASLLSSTALFKASPKARLDTSVQREVQHDDLCELKSGPTV
jgi:hypothetical protein